MKKIILSIIVILFCATTNAQSFNFTITPVIQCPSQYTTNAQAAITVTAAGATNYTWTAITPTNIPAYIYATQPATSVTISQLTTGVTTIVCTALNGTVPIATVSNTLMVLPSNAFTISATSGTNLCNGTTVTLTATGSSNYTWFPSGTVSPSIAVTPTASICYTAIATNSAGCTYSVEKCFNVATSIPVLTLSPSGNFSLCQGYGSITASGAANYTWSNSQTGPVSYVSSVGCYTVTGSNGCGTATATACATGTMAPPTLTISGPASVCAGNSVTLSLNGANGSTTFPTYYWYAPSPGQCCSISSNTSIVITPTATSCYTLVGQNQFCSRTISYCVSVISTPTLSISPSSNFTACSGQNNLFASGANNYTWTWSTGGSSGAAITATTTGCYTVTASNGGACPSATASVCINSIVPTPTISSGVSSQLVCMPNSITFTASGASNYTWTLLNGGIVTGNFSSITITPTVQGTYCATLVATNGNGCNVTSNICYTVSSPPNISVSNSSPTMCPGYTASLVATGAIFYTWSNGATTSSIVVSPSVSTCYTVSGFSNGCAGTPTTVCISVTPYPVINVTGNMTVCPGSANGYTANGANTYTWMTTTYSVIGTGSTAIIPSQAGCFVVTGNSGCTISNTFCPVISTVSLSSTASSTNVCAGSTTTLTASGANNYTWQPGNYTGASFAVSPTSNSCYTVTGSNSFGCLGSAVTCISTMTLPVISVSGNNSVCLGSSLTMTATGGASYLWNTGATTPTVNLLPATTTNYTVTGTGANGCSGNAIVSIAVNTACSDVWPGDANSDGLVSSTDVFEIGLAFSNTGSARSPGGNTYSSQFANNWSGTVSSGKNKCHADCNGDGIINNSDTLAIYNNYGLTHSFKNSSSFSTDPEISIVSDNGYVSAGMWNRADIVLGSISSPLNQVAGVAFDINFDLAMIDNDSVYMVYTPSFIKASGQNVEFRKTNLSAEKIYAATVRTDGNNVSGTGKIAELYFKVKTGSQANPMILSVSNAFRTNSGGLQAALSTGSLALSVNNNPVGIASHMVSSVKAGLYPNPANTQVTLYSNEPGSIHYSLFDLTGRMVLSGKFAHATELDLTPCEIGAYIISFESEGKTATFRKLIVDK